MLKNDSTRQPPSRPHRESSDDEPLRRWATLPVTRERACRLVDLLLRHDDPEIKDALIELICGLTPYPPSDDKRILDERFLAGLTALMHTFTETHRAENELAAYAVRLKCAVWM